MNVRFLGDFFVEVNGEVVTRLIQPRLQSLFAYLILNREMPLVRSRLAGIYWPDSPEDQALANLRNLVFTVRRALPQGDLLIQADKQTIQWNQAVPFSLDVLDFEQFAGQGEPEVHHLDRLEAAMNLYHGDLLPNCDDGWVLTRREHLRNRFLALLDSLIGRYEDLRRYTDATATCQRLTNVEPFHPNGYPRLMRLYALQGNVPAALKTYQSYARLLKRELEIDPPEEMQELHQHLTARPVRLGPGLRQVLASQPQTSLLLKEPPLPLVGRAAEWQTIQSVWKASAGVNETSGPRLLLIRGEAGIGKTRLAEEALRWAAHQGIRAAAAHCYSSEGRLPYAPVVEWLRALGLPPLEKVWLTELTRLLPELQPRQARPPAPLSEAWQRLRLFEALARAVLGRREGNQTQKTLLLIEDMHWADQETLEWLHYLLRFDPRAPLLLISTARSEEIDANPACQNLLLGLRQEVGQPVERKLLEMELGPLSESETGLLAAHAAGKKLEEGQRSWIFKETEGNPLFIVETVQAGMLGPTSDPGMQPLPGKARAVLSNRFQMLSPSARELCLLAATFGRAFSLDGLRQAYQGNAPELVDGLEELLKRRVCREVSPSVYDFSHQKLREAALSRASAARRQMLHLRAADALVKLAQGSLDSRSSEIANHYEAAGRPAQAVQYYQAAAEAARAIFANEQAIQHYLRALSLAEPGPPANTLLPAEQLARIDEKLGEVLFLTGKYPEAQATFERALARPFAAQALWCSKVYRQISLALLQQYQHTQALAALDQAEQALALTEERSTPPYQQEWIQVQITRCDILYWGNRPDEMDAVIRTLQPLIETVGSPDQRSELMGQQLYARYRHERFRFSGETVEIARRRLALVETLGVVYDTAWAQFSYGFTLLWHGEPAAARAWLEKSYETGVRIGAVLLQVRFLAYLSIDSRLLQQLPDVRDESQKLYELSASIGELTYHGISQANLGWLAWKEHDLEGAERYCRAAVENWEKAGGQIFHWTGHWVLLAVAVQRGDLSRAEHEARVMLDPNPLFQPILPTIASQLEQALQACQAQDAAQALHHFQQALELVRNCGEL